MVTEKTTAVALALECWAEHKGALSVKDAAMVDILAAAARSWLDEHTAQAPAQSDVYYQYAGPEKTLEQMLDKYPCSVAATK